MQLQSTLQLSSFLFENEKRSEVDGVAALLPFPQYEKLCFSMKERWVSEPRWKSERVRPVGEGWFGFSFFGGLWPLPAAGAPPKEKQAKTSKPTQEKERELLFFFLERLFAEWINLLMNEERKRRRRESNERRTKAVTAAAASTPNNSINQPFNGGWLWNCLWVVYFLLLFSKLMGQRCSLLSLKKDKQPTIQFHWLRPNQEGSNQLELVGWMNWLVKLPLLLLNSLVMSRRLLCRRELPLQQKHLFSFHSLCPSIN